MGHAGNERVLHTYDEIRQLMFLSVLNTKHILINEEIRAYWGKHQDTDLFRMNSTELTSLFGLSLKQSAKLERLMSNEGFTDHLLSRLESALNKGIFPICSIDDLYPPLLLQVDSAPAILWLYGRDPFTALASPKITVVGTRSASPYGKRVATDISRYISLRGSTVVSGMALGIDGCAHRAAVDSGGCTIAVLASGVDEIYPPTHTALYQKIIESGAVISEHPPGVKATANRFPARNRILAGLSAVTIVVESSMKSGTLITVDFALKYNREVMAVPGNIYSPESKGCNKLIQTGAMPLIDNRDLDVFLCSKEDHRRSWNTLPRGYNDCQDSIINLLSSQSLAFDEIMESGNFEAGQLAEEMAALETRNIIFSIRGRYALTSRVENSI